MKRNQLIYTVVMLLATTGGPAAVPIWGTANDGEQITVEFQKQKLTTTAKDGRWRVDLAPLETGGPFTLRIQGDNTITFSNILVGEVWICTGQSNMNWPLSQSEGGTEAIANSEDRQLRLLWLPLRGAATPQRDFDAPVSWKECYRGSVAGFSAVAYHFGSQLRQENLLVIPPVPCPELLQLISERTRTRTSMVETRRLGCSPTGGRSPGCTGGSRAASAGHCAAPTTRCCG